MMDTKCKTNFKPHKEKGIEIEMIGDCDEYVENLMKNLGPVSQRYWKGKMVFLNEDGEPLSSPDSK